MEERKRNLYDKNQSEVFYDNRYKEGYLDDWPEEKKRRIISVLKDLPLPAKGKALDFGCGNGVLTDVLRLALPDWEIWGTDLSSIAIDHAIDRYPNCRFFPLTNTEKANLNFDFVFTHHVLEHVFDLRQVWKQITGFLKPSGTILHILPCGNRGSLEYFISSLHNAGIDAERGNRFFFEDDGHVRRLTTEDMKVLAEKYGMECATAFYANHFYGAIAWISESGRNFIQKITDPCPAIHHLAHFQLLLLKCLFLTVLLARENISNVERVRNYPQKSWRNWIGLVLRVPFFPLSKALISFLEKKLHLEWQKRKHDPRGSEMFLFFRPSFHPFTFASAAPIARTIS